MKVFISWSGTRSRKTAELLRQWLPLINQNWEPFVSGEDISKGGNWSQAIIDELNQAKFGILCVTPHNQTKPWLLFEAGALSKQVDNEPKLVAPLLIDFKGKRDLPPPLGRFQTTADARGHVQARKVPQRGVQGHAPTRLLQPQHGIRQVLGRL